MRSVAVVTSAALAAVTLAFAGCGGDRRTERTNKTAPASVSGCADTGLVTESDDRGGGPGDTPIRWDDPVGGHGTSVDSIDNAATMVPFSPLVPETIRPCEVIVSEFPPRYLVLRFQHPEFGIFNVDQHRLDRPVRAAEKALRARAGPCAAQGCDGTWSLVSLEDGRDALLVTGKSTRLATHFIEFIDAGRAIDVAIQGPPQTFDAQTALAVANHFVSAAAEQ